LKEKDDDAYDVIQGKSGEIKFKINTNENCKLIDEKNDGGRE